MRILSAFIFYFYAKYGLIYQIPVQFIRYKPKCNGHPDKKERTKSQTARRT